MDKPVYGRQLIRFAETVPASNLGTAEIKAHRVVGFNLDGNGELITQAETSGANFASLGVNQFTIPAASDTSPAVGSRDASVATSGLLLVEIDSANAPSVGAALTVDTEGRGSVAGVLNTNHFAVSINDTTPTVREIYGDFAVVSFS